MSATEPDLEWQVRLVAAAAMAIPGWWHSIDFLMEKFHESFVDDPVWKITAADRLEALLREVAADLSDEDAMLTKHFDLLPQELQKEIRREAIDTLRTMGATVTEMRDDAGGVVLAVANLEATGIPQSEIDRITGTAPLPRGPFQRVQ